MFPMHEISDEEKAKIEAFDNTVAEFDTLGRTNGELQRISESLRPELLAILERDKMPATFALFALSGLMAHYYVKEVKEHQGADFNMLTALITVMNKSQFTHFLTAFGNMVFASVPKELRREFITKEDPNNPCSQSQMTT